MSLFPGNGSVEQTNPVVSQIYLKEKMNKLLKLQTTTTFFSTEDIELLTFIVDIFLWFVKKIPAIQTFAGLCWCMCFDSSLSDLFEFLVSFEFEVVRL